ncbi:uncharacterized protein LOC143433197 isoform X2 [Xylocopa sonorina]|uniref:uncharacterized protein LOC143433197 isoform X2 n=1 Tax=Xylocopa sonorina TaxID=1818115 RepID=UPI00403AFDCA
MQANARERMLQNGRRRECTVFDISYYKVFKKYLMFLGQYPTQSRRNSKLNVTMSACSVISLLIPALLLFFTSIVERNLNMMMESMPIILTIIVILIKLLNHNRNKEKFSELFSLMKEQLDMLNRKNQTHLHEKVTKPGIILAGAYRTGILFCLVLFLLIPLFPVFMDIIMPLNGTRHRQHLLKLKYFVDEQRYFYLIYLHCAWCMFVTAIIAITIDSLYMVIIHYTGSLFAVCGYQITKATERNNEGTNETSIEEFIDCVLMHNRAIQFYELINDCTRTSYLFQLLLNTIGISITGVQTVMYLDRPEEAFRIGIFLLTQQFHLLIISIPGQVLADESLNLSNTLYYSKWYQMPLNIQKILHMIQMRSSKACKLTAGGVVELNIENFGTTFKTCISYFMVFSSLKD